MNDRKLLRLAAQAAGIVIEGDADKLVVFPGHFAGGFSVFNDKGGSQLWNPLTDDGDALRLAVRLRMDVKQWNSLAIATKAWNKHAEENTSTQCPYAATRRAIVRAAAAIHDAKGQP